jgi:hypothetical protein
MKKLNKIVLIVLVALAVFACKVEAFAGTKTITFVWEQGSADLPNLKEWRLHYALTAGGPYTVLVTVPYDGVVKPEYSNVTPVSVIADGQKATVYFVATAVATSGVESGYSNEVNQLIDFTVVTVPIQLKIIIGN